MKRIITQITPNNEVQIKFVNRPNCLAQKNLGDTTSDRNLVKIRQLQQKIEDINKVIRAVSTEEQYLCPEYTQERKQLELFIDYSKRSPEVKTIEYVPVKYCPLPGSIEYYDIQAGVPERVKTTYYELCSQRATYLDIIKKSQHVERRERCWGKKQGKKRFTTNARKKVLCAGAVIDSDCNRESTFEVTTTLPGSGIEVFDCVARWSGWIINRQTQIIRRYEKKGIEVYWFFCWEHQKRGALHQHWCIATKDDPEIAKEIAKKIRQKWFDLLIELSESENIDLFKQKGIIGTWRHKPEVWQSHILPVEKSVAAYFSKYCSKNYDTSQYNKAVREYYQKRKGEASAEDGKPRSFTIYPSRYWGSGYRVKQCISTRTRTIYVDVASREEGDLLAQAIEKWACFISDKQGEFRQNFKIIDAKTNFIYSQGFTKRVWFDPHSFPMILQAFDRMHANNSLIKDGMKLYADITASLEKTLKHEVVV